MEKIKLYNGKIITPHRTINGGCIIIEGGKILEVSTADIPVEDALEINAMGNYIAPGFIDLHVHGGGGHDFMDNEPEGYLAIAALHAKHGTTALMPTTLSSEHQDLMDTLSVYETANARNVNGAQFIGIHIEGPYFSMEQRGAQDPRYIRAPVPAEYQEIIASSRSIKRWSAAPELRGALEFAQYLSERGILPSIAHTNAIYEEVLPAFEKGFRHATHFYSCMSGVSRRNAYRYAGVIESAYLLDAMTVEIIADGIHLPAPLLKLVLKIKGADRTALVTDAMRAAGMPPGPSILGSRRDGLEVIVEDNVAKLKDRTAFAGSVATMDRLVRNMVTMAEATLEDAVKMASLSPANIIGIGDRKGSLVAGKDADVVIFDEEINILRTMVAGKSIYEKLI
ncbi:N-acetylglucosamine-6-phosphate deacetylase [Pedobacter sp. PACM 27299]|uniref:N-acetylglucosamine-6-phosphate deacetylase n=1 Tax=Pedobacter sp. PACM 27299 TaxID=1727164 RepID=UPI000706365B|nr:N-acetylglucosamine-6-phosphate deacetylase [Pedobacter sp. PACM 27299]ALL05184.1 N-acetylglucosamine-6-phosphate deacetylase [Pedobacter sp. PACM 27299]